MGISWKFKEKIYLYKSNAWEVKGIGDEISRRGELL